jgi:ribosomal protein S18 acetylase RimI-like enzyme
MGCCKDSKHNHDESPVHLSFEAAGKEDPEVTALLQERWNGPEVVSKGKLHNAGLLARVIVKDSCGKIMGLATYRIDKTERSCELVTLDSTGQGRGIGSMLLSAVENAAADAGCKRLWLITTNDNLQAASFYQEKGYERVTIHSNAMEKSRKLKPSIPEVGLNGVPITDEWEFEKQLT